MCVCVGVWNVLSHAIEVFGFGHRSFPAAMHLQEEGCGAEQLPTCQNSKAPTQR